MYPIKQFAAERGASATHPMRSHMIAENKGTQMQEFFSFNKE